MSALKHTLKITVLILAVSFVLNIIIGIAGEDAIGRLLGGCSVTLGEAMAALIGLDAKLRTICCYSTELLSGWYAQCRSNDVRSACQRRRRTSGIVPYEPPQNLKENIMVVGTLYVTSVCWGLLIQSVGYHIFK